MPLVTMLGEANTSLVTPSGLMEGRHLEGEGPNRNGPRLVAERP
jgi:hypothetical protein